MKIITIILSLQFVMTATHAQSTKPDWVFLNVKDGDSLFLKTEYHAKDIEGIKVWKKLIKKTVEFGGKVYKNAKYMNLSVYDCENKRSKNLQSIIYTNTGKVIYSYTYKLYEQEWEDEIPETLGELTLKAVCHLFE